MSFEIKQDLFGGIARVAVMGAKIRPDTRLYPSRNTDVEEIVRETGRGDVVFFMPPSEARNMNKDFENLQSFGSLVNYVQAKEPKSGQVMPNCWKTGEKSSGIILPLATWAPAVAFVADSQASLVVLTAPDHLGHRRIGLFSVNETNIQILIEDLVPRDVEKARNTHLWIGCSADDAELRKVYSRAQNQLTFDDKVVGSFDLEYMPKIAFMNSPRRIVVLY